MITLESVSNAATACGVLLGAWQLRRSALQARINFEDALNREYRTLFATIPPGVLFDHEQDDVAVDGAFQPLHQYFDLSNEQIFLRMNGRISRVTWVDWNAGIKTMMAKPAVAKAWERVVESSRSFSELRRLASGDFTEDPYNWVSVPRRFKRWLWQ